MHVFRSNLCQYCISNNNKNYSTFFLVCSIHFLTPCTACENILFHSFSPKKKKRVCRNLLQLQNHCLHDEHCQEDLTDIFSLICILNGIALSTKPVRMDNSPFLLASCLSHTNLERMQHRITTTNLTCRCP